MKHRDAVLVLCLVTLFIFQQARANATRMASKSNPQTDPIRANAGILFGDLKVYMYRLNDPANLTLAP